MSPTPADAPLQRRLGLGGATAIGLAAMLGTGVFAAWTPALARSGPLLLLSLLLAAVVASLNAWSTAALARELPEAGGAYAYGRALLGRPAGVLAGVAFVVGKVASAGAAALVVGVYLWPDHQRVVAIGAVVVVLLLDLRGVTRTAAASAATAAVVLVVLAALAARASAYVAPAGPVEPQSPGALGVLSAAGLLFVAFAGYARVATLGEEVRDPRRTLPRAVALALAAVLACYLAVGVQVLRVLGPLPADARSSATLEQLARLVSGDQAAVAVRVAAVVAAGGALLSLIAGVARTLFAMGRAGDAPAALSAVSAYGVPYRAQVVAGLGAAAVAAVGGIGSALALSAFSVLAYYGVAHLAALRLTGGRPPVAVPLLGLVGCAVVAASLVLLAGNPS